MSIKVMTRVWEYSQAAGTPLLVLLSLADFADDDGECWPSISTIARKCRLASDRHVQRVIHDELEARLGEVVVIRNEGKASSKGGLRSNRYRITVHLPDDDLMVAEGPPSSTNDDGSQATLMVAEGPPLMVADRPPEPSVESPVESSVAHVRCADEFAHVWDVYPKRLDRKRALRAYVARRRAGVSAHDLLTAAENYAKAMIGQEPRYIKHAATFFGPDEPFADFVEGIPAGARLSSPNHPSRNMSTVDAILDSRMTSSALELRP